jgi:gas vesicle structural protein
MQQQPPQRISLLGAPDAADQLSLLELTDRLLHRGVVLTGEAVISVAGVDLIYLGLNLVLTAVENLQTDAATRDRPG